MRKWIFLVLAAAVVPTVTGAVAGTARADAGPGSDCAVLGPVGANAITILAPLQNEPQSQAGPKLAAYLGSLRADEGRLKTTRGRTDLQAYIGALQNASSPAAAPQIYGTVNRLQADCPAEGPYVGGADRACPKRIELLRRYETLCDAVGRYRRSSHLP